MNGLHKLLLLTCLGQIAHGSDIIHGEKASENSLLYMASVQTPRGHTCGGFLITEDFVVTAAHCGNNPTHVVLGTHDLRRSPNERISIEKKFKHPLYQNDVVLGNDIMLLKLSTKAQLNNRVKTIQFATSETNENANCYVAGWGKTKTGGHVVNELRVVKVSIIDQQVCQDRWDKIRLPANVICAGGYGTKAGFCQGDSGGPLVCNGMAVGVVSFNKGRNCTYPNVPNVYTDISKHASWINSMIKTF
ncbi:granzyme-like protein 1 isoform X2 [Acanthochromis polyacanthus]|uniref:granzyme-like protein 1 isoform X2 n=1 Tax=Acanthochromis polyacanthus TaxID=80966 RepID=UPI0022347FFD|nr:granzyme-like protein 1 isoform X2 [Acanthochromis polyacanthus]